MIVLKNKKLLILCCFFSDCFAQHHPHHKHPHNDNSMEIDFIFHKKSIPQVETKPVKVKKGKGILFYLKGAGIVLGIALLVDFVWSAINPKDAEVNDYIDRLKEQEVKLDEVVGTMTQANSGKGVVMPGKTIKNVKNKLEKDERKMLRIFNNMLSVRTVKKLFMKNTVIKS